MNWFERALRVFRFKLDGWRDEPKLCNVVLE